MAQYDAFTITGGVGYLLDCQSDLLDDMQTRFVVPLWPIVNATTPASRLNPVFDVAGERVMMTTQAAATVHVRELRHFAASLNHEHDRIIAALDMLLTGY